MDAGGRAMQEQFAEKFIQRRNRAKRRLLEMPFSFQSSAEHPFVASSLKSLNKQLANIGK